MEGYIHHPFPLRGETETKKKREKKKVEKRKKEQPPHPSTLPGVRLRQMDPESRVQARTTHNDGNTTTPTALLRLGKANGMVGLSGHAWTEGRKDGNCPGD